MQDIMVIMVVFTLMGIDSTNGANWRLYTSSVSDQNAKVSHNNMPPYLTVYMFKRID